MVRFEKISGEEAGRIRLILFAFIAVAVLTVFFTPSDLVAAIFPELFTNESSCIMLNIAGIPCPFCGMSRALKELMKLNISGSLYYNPAGIPFFAASGILTASVFVLSLFNYRIRINNTSKTFIAAGAVVTIIWIINILYGHQS